jgi:hypothetical protein
MTAADITAIAASVVGLAALGVAIWQGLESRKHNRLMAKPRLDFDIDFALNRERVGLFLENTGLGPALVTSVNVSLNGTTVAASYGDLWPTVLRSLGSSTSPESWLTWTAFGTAPRAIPAGSRLEILTAAASTLTGARLECFNDLIPRLTVSIDYCSAYGEKFTRVCTQNPAGLLDQMIRGFREHGK